MSDGGAVIAAYPSATDEVNIKGNTITLSGSHASGSVTIHSDGVDTQFIVIGDLIVKGQVEVVKGENENPAGIKLEPNSRLRIIE